MVEEGHRVLSPQPLLQPDWVCFKHYKTITLTNSLAIYWIICYVHKPFKPRLVIIVIRLEDLDAVVIWCKMNSSLMDPG